MSIVQTRDRERLERLLRADVVWGGYALADLEPPHFERTTWYVSADETDPALVMVYTFAGHPTLMTFGSGRAVRDVLAAIDIVPRCDIHLHGEQVEAVRPLVRGELSPFLRMEATRTSFHPPPVREAGDLEMRRIDAAHVPAAMELYQHYPANHFEPARVDESVYLGAFDGDRLIAIAGTHVSSRRYGIAAIGDIVTEPSCRNRGVGGRLTAALCARLFEDVDLIVLNVAADNLPAQRAYRRIGFGGDIAHVEGFGVELVGRVEH